MNRVRWQAVAWKKVFVEHLAERGLLSRMYTLATNHVEKGIQPKGNTGKR